MRGVCLAALILASVAWADTADHPFPFKTLVEITTGTPAWRLEGAPELRLCEERYILKYQYESAAGSVWTVGTDGRLFSAAYFPPLQETPVTVAVGRIQDGHRVVVEVARAYDPTLRPCDRWKQRDP